MNYFVIDQIEEASRAVNVLSEAAKGRANFFHPQKILKTPLLLFRPGCRLHPGYYHH